MAAILPELHIGIFDEAHGQIRVSATYVWAKKVSLSKSRVFGQRAAWVLLVVYKSHREARVLLLLALTMTAFALELIQHLRSVFNFT